MAKSVSAPKKVATKTVTTKKAAPKKVAVKKAEPPATYLDDADTLTVPDGLRATDVPGVFFNGAGVRVDRHGVILGFRSVQQRAEAREVMVLGKKVSTPAELLKLAALDITLPLTVRLEAAKHAAPYYNRKKPSAIDGGEDPSDPDGPGLPLGALNLKNLSNDELATLTALLDKAGAARV